jgi:hypothetical protein
MPIQLHVSACEPQAAMRKKTSSGIFSAQRLPVVAAQNPSDLLK